MAVTSAQFRVTFPVFADATVYPTPTIDFWLGLAYQLLDPGRWGTLIDYGAQLFAAHNLAIDYASTNGGQGSAPGQITGPITSASVDKVSYSRDSSSAMDPKNGHWNLTTYGLRYIRLVKMMGAGPVQVGAPFGPASAGFGPESSGGWPGVYFPPPSI